MPKIGMLVPSSNTVLEPCTSLLAVEFFPDVTVHFARVPVLQVSADALSNAQFAPDNFLAAAELLAHAEVDAILWNGTSASWLGFDRDRQLCASIRARTGIAASSTTLAILDVLAERGIRRLAIITPFTPDIQVAVLANFRDAGYDVAYEAHFGLTDNGKFASVAPDAIFNESRRAAERGVDAIVAICTNMRGAMVIRPVEVDLGIPFFDSVYVSFWGALRMVGIDQSPLRSHGSLFAREAGRAVSSTGQNR